MVPPKPKPVEPAPNVGLAGVPKLEAVVEAVAPKLKGAGAGLEAGVDVTPPPPKVNGFGGAAVELKVDCVAGASNDGFPKLNVDWVVGGAVVEAVLAIAKTPNEAVVVLWLGGAWPKGKTFWLAA